MEHLTPRQKEILGCIIEAHIETALPIGSTALAKCCRLQLSPASLRHEMGILEDREYLTRPHTSAGRVPTDKGYNFYVREVVREEPVSKAILERVSEEIESKIEDLEGLTMRVSRILSAMAEEAVLATSPALQELCLKELSLFVFDPTHVFAVWRSTTDLIQNRMVEMEEGISAGEIERIRNFINQELNGRPIGSLETELLKRIKSCRDSLRRLYELTLAIVHESLSAWELPQLFVEGSRYILNQPEFHDFKKFQPLITALEEKSRLLDLLKHQQSYSEVHVAIGEKAFPKEIWDCALVSSSYVWRGNRVGTIGILGPRRMRYGKVMGLVHQMADSISQILAQRSS